MYMQVYMYKYTLGGTFDVWRHHSIYHSLYVYSTLTQLQDQRRFATD